MGSSTFHFVGVDMIEIANSILIIKTYFYMREVNVRVLGKGSELLSANGGRFEINQRLFADDAALVADSEEKLCRLVSEFGRVCERINQ